MKQKKHRWRLVLPLLLLSILCVGGVELAVCSVADPELFHRITAPVRSWWADTMASVQALGQDIFPPDPTPTPEMEELESQIAGDPTLTAETAVDTEITALVEREGIQLLTGGAIEVVYYRQSSPQWADKPYGRDTIGPYGCGPTTMAMAVSSLAEEPVNPAEMAAWAVEAGYWAPRSGSRHGLIGGAAEAHGLTCTPLTEFDPDALLRELSTGKLIVALVGPGHFTNSGHFILLRGATLDGRILVSDPNSEARSLVTWDPQLILDELSPSRYAGSPLWLLSIPEG